jgi:capsid protein
MSRIAHFTMAAVVAVSSLFTAPQFSAASDFIVQEPGRISLCADRRFLNKIVHRFRYQVRHVPNLPDVGIADFADIHENRYQPVAYRQPIARLYCGAKALLTDGSQRDVWYLIEGRMGFASIGDNVEFCVAGFDRWYVYDGRCRILR